MKSTYKINIIGGKPRKVKPKSCKFECGFSSSRDLILSEHEKTCVFNPENVLKSGKSVYSCEYEEFGCNFSSSFAQVSKHETTCRFDPTVNISKVLTSNITDICPQCILDKKQIEKVLKETNSNLEKTIEQLVNKFIVETSDEKTNKLPELSSEKKKSKLVKEMTQLGFTKKESIDVLNRTNFDLKKSIELLQLRNKKEIKKQSQKETKQDNVTILTEMGYNTKIAKKILDKYDGNIQLAVEHLIQDNTSPLKTSDLKKNPRPRGRAPKDKYGNEMIWDYTNGNWIRKDDSPSLVTDIKKRKPRKIIKDLRRENANLEDLYPSIPENIMLDQEGNITKIMYEPLDILKWNSIVGKVDSSMKKSSLSDDYNQDASIWIYSAEHLVKRKINYYIPPKFSRQSKNIGSSINKELIASLKKLKINYNKKIKHSTDKSFEKEQYENIMKEIMIQINLGLEYMYLLDTIMITGIDYSKTNNEAELKTILNNLRSEIPVMRHQLIHTLEFLYEIYFGWSTHYIKKEYYDLY